MILMWITQRRIDILSIQIDKGDDMKYAEQTLMSWTTPLSKTEEDRAENTIKMIKSAIDANADLNSMGFTII